MEAIFRYLVALSLIVQALGHGRLIDPASRNAAWRYGFDTPTQVTDNELNCGGFSTQWDKNGGKCGVCGDPYHFKEGEAMYAHPGKYATGIITKTYREGQEIEVRWTLPLTIRELLHSVSARSGRHLLPNKSWHTL